MDTIQKHDEIIAEARNHFKPIEDELNKLYNLMMDEACEVSGYDREKVTVVFLFDFTIVDGKLDSNKSITVMPTHKSWDIAAAAQWEILKIVFDSLNESANEKLKSLAGI